jgi:hypothetical protein
MLTFPLGCLAASMAARIFRNMKMQNLQFDWQFSISDVNFSPLPIFQLERPGSVRQLGGEVAIESQSLQPARAITFPKNSMPLEELSPNDSQPRGELGR